MSAATKRTPNDKPGPGAQQSAADAPRSAQPLAGRTHFRIPAVGWVFVTIALAVGIGAMRTQAALMYMFFGGMAGAMLVSVIMSRQMVASVQLRREVGDRAWQHQTAHLAYYLRNIGWQGACLGITVEEIAPKGIQSASGFCVSLPSKQSFRAGARFVSSRRGRILLTQTRISTTFPFGLVSAYRLVRQDDSIVVWPAKGRLKRQLLDRGATQTSTAAPSIVSGGQDEFFGLREYRSDDNPRWIHWRKSAGKTVPVVREMARPMPETLWVILDTFCMDASQGVIEQREAMIRFAGTLIEHALMKDYDVALAMAFGDRVFILPPADGRGHRKKLLDALADIDVNLSTPLEKVIAALHRRSLRNAQVIVAGASFTRERQGMLRGLKPACGHLTVLEHDHLAGVYEDASHHVEAGNAS